MRAPVPSALFALLFASAAPVALLACDQDYASSTSGRETFMGDTKQAPSSSAPTPPPPPMAPPQMGPLPPPLPTVGDAGADGASDAAAGRALAAPRPPAH
jgi:hypothetical protein